MRIAMDAPDSVAESALRDRLEAIARDLFVEISLQSGAES
jgi:glycine cleavage system regulatory protein